MPLTLKPGTRLYSAIDATEMIAVKAPADPIELTIGGVAAVLSADERTDGTPAEGHDGGVAMGKRYTDAGGTIELLVTRAGAAAPAVAGELLGLKEAKPLPASD
ncbi:MAG TPA: hypothetical protein VNQ73_20595 [Ilumatobacter sp.]|nr:hypothetical protein [Ilumatobacter sp.]